MCEEEVRMVRSVGGEVDGDGVIERGEVEEVDGARDIALHLPYDGAVVGGGQGRCARLTCGTHRRRIEGAL